MKLPIIRGFSRPSTLQGRLNGKLPDKSLVKVGPSGYLESNTARAFLALVDAAGKAGYALTYTYGGCYRSYADQLSLFNRRYTQSYDPKVNTTSASRTFNGRRYYKRKGVAAAASPGSSNHGWGLAIDTALDNDLSDGLGPDDATYIGPALGWLVDNAPDYGFSWELQSEPWHIRYVAGDDVPAAVLAHSGHSGVKGAVGENPKVTDDKKADEALDGFPVYDAAAGKYSLWPVNEDLPNTGLTRNEFGGHVVFLQDVLFFECKMAQVRAHATYDEVTEDAVRNFQKFFGLTVDGWVGKQTWGVVRYLAAIAEGRR